MISSMLEPTSRFSKTVATGIRVSRNTHAPLRLSGTLSTAGHCDQSRADTVWASWSQSNPSFLVQSLQFHRPGVRFKQPRGSVRVTVAQLPVFRVAQVAGPDDAGVVDVGFVMHPFVKCVGGAVADEHQMLASGLLQAVADGEAALRVASIDGVPGFVLDDARVAAELQSVPEEKVSRAETQQEACRLARHAVQPQHGNEHEQARERGNVVRIEVRIDIGAKREEGNGRQDPPLPAD